VRIAQVAPLYESVPPQLYGGTERVVSFLTEELVNQGHDVTLFASADSKTKAKLVGICPRGLRLGNVSTDQLACHYILLERVFEQVSDFDVVHFHCDYLHFPWCRRHPCRHVTTLHGRLDLPEVEIIHREFTGEPLISISDAQRVPLASANWLASIHHGLPLDLFDLREKPGDYLVFLGRISPEKRVDRAIRIAQRVGMRLKIAAKIDDPDRRYYQQEIEPLLRKNGHLVEFIGEIGEDGKNDLLGNAFALLFPIDWPEPFGLVMIEAMACGTPVIAYRNGSVPEVIDEGISGFVVDNEDEVVRAVERVGDLNRRACRQVFERRFSAARMTRDYVKVYEQLMEEPPAQAGHRPHWRRVTTASQAHELRA
jgi:glycosyltransferase involved in cell wall biosynthesis